jgi:hypothetical protein
MSQSGVVAHGQRVSSQDSLLMLFIWQSSFRHYQQQRFSSWLGTVAKI